MESELNRRHLLHRLAGAGLALTAGSAWEKAQAQTPPPPVRAFGYDDIVRRARDLSTIPHNDKPPILPPGLENLSYDAYRDLRFKPERAIPLGPFRVQLFHLGFLYERPVAINIVKADLAAPIPYSSSLFDYGRNAFQRPLPIDLGFAGFRLHFPLNRSTVFDEVISFLGASYFRFLGRGQQYGISARGVAVGSGAPNEEFPYFREFWIYDPPPGANRITVDALLDGPSLTGAFRFEIVPGPVTRIEVTSTLFPRREIPLLGIAPLTSMFLASENDRRINGDFRSEVHDSDGTLVHHGGGGWMWRPLRNPPEPITTKIPDRTVKGFGLMQRDRVFAHYEDLEARYDLRPSYWVEPLEDWGEGTLNLVELPTQNEFADNVVLYWAPRNPAVVGEPLRARYALSSIGSEPLLHNEARVAGTFQVEPRGIPPIPEGQSARRFLIDFNGGDLAFYFDRPETVQVVVSPSRGQVLRTFMTINPVLNGFRAGFDIVAPKGETSEIYVTLKVGDLTLSETWFYPWTAA